MTCSEIDLKAYVLKELDAAGRREVETHAAACGECHAEIARLRLTCDTLGALREEEIPRRIAFVSDKVFEPKWWQPFLRPGFVAAALLAVAILTHAFVRPVSQGAIEARIERAVQQAVANSEARQLADYQMLSRQVVSMYKVSNRMEVGQ